MTLPIDVVGAVWLSAKEVWEWEIDPAQQPDAPARDPLSSWPTACEPSPGPEWRLVFKGYEYTHTYHWTFAESALSRPWLHQQGDDAEPKHRVDELRGPLDALPKTDDDVDPSSAT